MKHLPLASILLFASVHLCTSFLTFEEQKELEQQLWANGSKFDTAIKAKLVIAKAAVVALNRLNDPFFGLKDANEVWAKAPALLAVALEWHQRQLRAYEAERAEDETAKKNGSNLLRAERKGSEEEEEKDQNNNDGVYALWLVVNREFEMREVDPKTDGELRQRRNSNFYEEVIEMHKYCIGNLEKLAKWAKQLKAQSVDVGAELAKWEKAKGDHKFILYTAKQYGVKMPPKKDRHHLYDVQDLRMALDRAHQKVKKL